MRCLIESMALLTKSIGIVTPPVLSIVVVVAPRLILYTETIQTRCEIILYCTMVARSYRTWALMDGKNK